MVKKTPAEAGDVGSIPGSGRSPREGSTLAFLKIDQRFFSGIIPFYLKYLGLCNTATCVCARLLQSCLTLCDPMDCSLPGSSVHGILQARIL